MIPGVKPKLDIRAKVRAGVKTNGQPRASDHFHSLDQTFTSRLGAPATLTIKFHSSSPEDIFPTGLELWGSNGTLKCWCADGHMAHRLNNHGEVVDTPCTHPDCQQFQLANCKGIGRLRFLIPELGPGVFQLDTKSAHSIEGILGTLAAYEPIQTTWLWTLSLVKKTHKTNKWNVITITPAQTKESE